jgi:hypothetical protein
MLAVAYLWSRYFRHPMHASSHEEAMKPGVTSVLRANIVLFALSVAILESLCVACAIVTRQGDLIGLCIVRIAIVGAAMALYGFIRHRARLAFDDATKHAYIDWQVDSNGFATAVIDRRARHDWLVQLHIEADSNCARRAAAIAR